jgi:hypothetical protein
MTSKPKIAVCLSGQPRTWRHCIASQRILFQHFDVDCYLHSWDDVGQDERTDLIHAYAPEDVMFEARPDFSTQQAALVRVFPKTPLVHVFDMTYGVQQTLNMALNSGRVYDFYARARYDLMFDGLLDPMQLAPDTLNTFDWGHPSCVDDMFALGNAAVMRTYAGFYDWIDPERMDVKPYGGWFKPEFGLQCYMSAQGIHKVHIEGPRRKLLRERMIGRAFDDIRDDIFGQVEKHNEIDRHIRQIVPADALKDVVFYHQYRDTLPVHAMQQQIEHVLSTWSESSQAALFTASWAKRLALADRLLVALLGPESQQPLTSRTLTYIRLFATVLLSKMDLSVPLDRFGVVLTSLSFERPDGQLTETWINQHPAEASVLLSDPVVGTTAPLVFQGLCTASGAVKAVV